MLEEYLRYLQYEKNYSSRTVSSYRKDINQFTSYYSRINNSTDISKAEMDDIRLWIAELISVNKITSRSVCRKLSSMKSFYKFLLQKNIIDSSPVDVVAPKIIKSLPVFFTEKDINLLGTDEILPDDSFETARNALMIEIFYQTGIRRMELIELKISDIDFERKTIKVLGKRRKERFVPFGEALENQIKHYLSIRQKRITTDNDYLFVTKHGRQLYDKAVYNIVTRELGSITTKTKHSPHTLRHTFATTMLDNGADLNSIKELLGHSSLAATQVYTHTSFKELQKLYQNTHPRAN